MIRIVACSLLLFVILASYSGVADNSCINCHANLTAFNETEKLFNKIRLKHLERNVPCSLECHASTLKKFAKSNYEQWTKSKHALFDVTCDKCHGGNASSAVKEEAHKGVLRSSNPNSTIFYRNVPETCGKCHKDELKEFKSSKHYQKLKALEQAPTCDTCHQPHKFKILNISEFHSLCSNCHNPEMRIAPADVPDKAISALENAESLKNEIITAEKVIKQAKEQGKDVSIAQKELEKAESTLDTLPVLWHGFDLTAFEEVVNKGIQAAQNAQQDAGKPVSTPSSPSLGVVLALSGIVLVYLKKRWRG